MVVNVMRWNLSLAFLSILQTPITGLPLRETSLLSKELVQKCLASLGCIY